MHQQFRALLDKAEGKSELVIAANVDVRGFSRFSLEVESVEAAIFVKKVYKKILDDFFDTADFFKPTGDGLLLIFTVDEQSLQERTTEIVAKSLSLVEAFPTFLDGQDIINFPVPAGIGVGLARGAASRLVSGRKTLDYSGKVLNLASRLMDFARPSGVVIDHRFGMQMLPEATRKRFGTDEIYIRSVAEDTPLPIFLTPEFTVIPPAAKRPINELNWHRQKLEFTHRELLEMSFVRFRIPLEHLPLDEQQIAIIGQHPTVTPGKRKSKTLWSDVDVGFDYEETAGRAQVLLHMPGLKETLAARGVGPTWPVRMEIVYPTRS